MIEIKVFGTTPPCSRCKKMEKIARHVVEKFPGQAAVAKYDAFSPEGVKFGIMHTPTVALGNKIIAKGKVIKEGELETALLKELEE